MTASDGDRPQLIKVFNVSNSFQSPLTGADVLYVTRLNENTQVRRRNYIYLKTAQSTKVPILCCPSQLSYSIIYQLHTGFSPSLEQTNIIRFKEIAVAYFFGLAASSPVLGAPTTSSDGLPGADSDSSKPDWKTIEADFKEQLAKTKNDQTLSKRLNTHSATNVGLGQIIYAAGSAAYNHVKSISNWNEAREQFTQLTTKIMIDHNPYPSEAVAAICYNKGYDVRDRRGIYGLTSQELAIWPLKTDYDCFYMGKNNAFWSQGDGGTINARLSQLPSQRLSLTT
ncbi:hypothetical protein CDEST_00304 [Colletotrichum destructivum]|uniref:DUF7888 domain-containing protein n=1 Tax=Colletotrichum destructivum TaxID=34406 RepID=A0AAX4HWG4_9PEZI|nr:hypothetical protein CDEST_00304 [Colletotrichum destructivum]